MDTIDYVIQKTTGSYCLECEDLLYLLIPQYASTKPKFYICFDCRLVFEVGKGKVEYDQPDLKKAGLV